MKREDKSVMSRQRILEAAFEEFASKGYDGASLNAVWVEKGISKGIIYHHFKDKDEIYPACVAICFDALTAWCARRLVRSPLGALAAYLEPRVKEMHGSVEDCLQAYFNARISFFAENPLFLGIFFDGHVLVD